MVLIVRIHSENQAVSGGMPSELANMAKLSQVSFGKSNVRHFDMFCFYHSNVLNRLIWYLLCVVAF